MDIVITGSVSYDFMMNFHGSFADRIKPERIYSPSLSFLVNSLTRQFGGTACNIAHSLKLLGERPIILGSIGSDGDEYLAYLKKKHISTRYIRKYARTRTCSYFVITDSKNNQISVFYTGTLKHDRTFRIHDISDKPSFVIISPTDPNAMNSYVRECKTQNIPYMYSPAFQTEILSKQELLDGIEACSVLIGNNSEIALIEEKIGVSHEELRVIAPIVVTTLGSKGSIVETRYESIHCFPAQPRRVVDPTGAGDAYRAGFIHGFVRTYDVTVCAQIGSISAVYAIETYGSQNHTFTLNEFHKRYKENFHHDYSKIKK